MAIFAFLHPFFIFTHTEEVQLNQQGAHYKCFKGAYIF